MYNLRAYIDSYLKKSGILWQYHRDEPSLNSDGTIIDLVIMKIVYLLNLNKR